jgi:hypothetical protein
VGSGSSVCSRATEEVATRRLGLLIPGPVGAPELTVTRRPAASSWSRRWATAPARQSGGTLSRRTCPPRRRDASAGLSGKWRAPREAERRAGTEALRIRDAGILTESSLDPPVRRIP